MATSLLPSANLTACVECVRQAVAERRAQRLRGRQQAPQPASDINQPAGDHRQRRSQRSTRRRSAAPSRPQVVTEDRTMVPPRRGSGDGPPSRYSEQHSGAVSAGGATPLQPYAARGSAPPTPPRGELRRSPLTTPERGGGDGSPARISDEARGVSGGSEEEDEDELGLDPALVEKRREIRRLRAEVQVRVEGGRVVSLMNSLCELRLVCRHIVQMLPVS